MKDMRNVKCADMSAKHDAEDGDGVCKYDIEEEREEKAESAGQMQQGRHLISS